MSGLPPHIAQVIAGHRDINVTMGYKAVYPDEAIQAHLAFLARRRALRPGEEYRVPTDKEWEEFLGHLVEERAVGELVELPERGRRGRLVEIEDAREKELVRAPQKHLERRGRDRLGAREPGHAHAVAEIAEKPVHGARRGLREDGPDAREAERAIAEPARRQSEHT